jgi:hypothetical protein
MKLATIIAFDNFTDIDVFLTWDLLNRVKEKHKDLDSTNKCNSKVKTKRVKC